MNDNVVGFFAVVIVVPIVIATVLFGVSAVIAWPVMLFLGNAHIASDGVVPALGYVPTFWLVAALNLTGIFRLGNNTSKS